MAKYSLKIISLLVLILLVVLSSQLYKRSLSLPTKTRSDTALSARLKIPILNIDTNIEQVGMTADGEMYVPKKPDNVAWFNLGPRPGENGNAVIDGHSGWKDNKPAVFDNLYKLKTGDKIYVENSNGVTTVFTVRELKNYGANENTASVFGLGDGKPHLNLITCSGAWNNIEKTHSERLVVFSDL